jgi:hypothetical protein
MQHVDEGTLHAYLDGALDALAAAGALPHGVTRSSVEAHFHGCADCRTLLESERQVRDGARGVLLDASVSVDTPPFELLASGSFGGTTRPRRMLPLVWAASVLVAVGAGWWGSELIRTDAPASTEVARTAGQPQAAPAAAAAAEAEVDQVEAVLPPPLLAVPPEPGAASYGPAVRGSPAVAAAASTAPGEPARRTFAAAEDAAAAPAGGAAAVAGAAVDMRVYASPPVTLRTSQLPAVGSDRTAGGMAVVRGTGALAQVPRDTRAAALPEEREEVQGDARSMRERSVVTMAAPAAGSPPPAPAPTPAPSTLPVPPAGQQVPTAASAGALSLSARPAGAGARAEVVSPLQTFRSAVGRARAGTLEWVSRDRRAALTAGLPLVMIGEAGPPVFAVAALDGDQPMVRVQQRTSAGAAVELLVWQEPGARVLAPGETRLATVVIGTGVLPNGDTELLLRVPSLEAFVMMRGALDARSLLQLADGLTRLR